MSAHSKEVFRESISSIIAVTLATFVLLAAVASADGRFNGEERQRGNSADLILNMAHMLSYI